MTAAPDGWPDPPDPAPAASRPQTPHTTELIAALGRLAAGRFARCDICGAQISDRHLRRTLAADRCMNHLQLNTTTRPQTQGTPDTGTTMTTTRAEHAHPADDETGRGDTELGDTAAAGPPQIDAPGPAQGRPGSPGSEEELRALLAPFVAWLATQDLDEPERRRHRGAVERFLRWARTDTGPVEDRRRRYEHHLRRHDPDHRADACSGLDWWTQHRRLLACTLPADR